MSSYGFRPMPTFTGREKWRLLRGDVLIGVIANVDANWPWMRGDIELTPAAAEYDCFWRQFRDQSEQSGLEMTKEEVEALFENWFVEVESLERVPIDLPLVGDGRVHWRGFFRAPNSPVYCGPPVE